MPLSNSKLTPTILCREAVRLMLELIGDRSGSADIQSGLEQAQVNFHFREYDLELSLADFSTWYLRPVVMALAKRIKDLGQFYFVPHLVNEEVAVEMHNGVLLTLAFIKDLERMQPDEINARLDCLYTKDQYDISG
jgi:hypothetical protein